MNTIAWMGLGAMGSRMAHNLLDDGRDVVVYNRSPEPVDALVEAGARRADTPRDAAASADLVICMVTDDAASRAVWLEGDAAAVHGLRDSAVAVESSTLTPRWMRELRDAVDDRGATLVAAPVAGTLPQAEAGQLVYLLGGPDAAIERVRPVADVLGSATHGVGDVSQAMVMKLVINTLLGVQAAAMGELLGLLRGAGFDEDAAVDLLSETVVASPAGTLMGRLMAARKFDPLFPIDLVEKDFGYVVDAANDVDADVPVAEAVRAVFARAQDAGHGTANISAVAKLFLPDA